MIRDDDVDVYVQAWVDSFASVEDIYAMPDEDEDDWIIRGLLRAGTYMIVYGKEGVGKSRILYQLAVSVGTGKSWFGFEVQEQGDVVFLQVDMAPKESKGIVKSAAAAGLLYDHIYFPRDFGIIDVCTDAGKAVLEGIKERFDPKVLVIDTATDAYEPKPEHGTDVNAPIRAAVRAFRSVFPEAGLIFVLHERKMGQLLQAKNADDEDSALGGGEWTRKASGVIRLKRVGDTHVTMTVRKTRDVVPFKSVTLTRTANGFFEIEDKNLTPLHALAIWDDEGRGAVTISGVCRSIEDATEGKLKLDTVRRAYQRAKSENVEFPWERRLSKEER